jgi:hypothetical protein
MAPSWTTCAATDRAVTPAILSRLATGKTAFAGLPAKLCAPGWRNEPSAREDTCTQMKPHVSPSAATGTAGSARTKRGTLAPAKRKLLSEALAELRQARGFLSRQYSGPEHECLEWCEHFIRKALDE